MLACARTSGEHLGVPGGGRAGSRKAQTLPPTPRRRAGGRARGRTRAGGGKESASASPSARALLCIFNLDTHAVCTTYIRRICIWRMYLAFIYICGVHLRSMNTECISSVYIHRRYAVCIRRVYAVCTPYISAVYIAVCTTYMYIYISVNKHLFAKPIHF